MKYKKNVFLNIKYIYSLEIFNVHSKVIYFVGSFLFLIKYWLVYQVIKATTFMVIRIELMRTKQYQSP